MFFSLIFSVLAILGAPAAQADTTLVPVDSAIADLEQVWPERFVLAKRENQLILANMQLQPTISRMYALARNVKKAAETDPTSKAVYDSANSIAERYIQIYNQNQKELDEVYARRQRYIEPSSLANLSSQIEGCGTIHVPVGAAIRLRLDPLHPGDLDSYQQGIGSSQDFDLGYALTLSFHDGENPFSLPGSQQAFIFLDKQGKAKSFAILGETGACWVSLSAK